MKKRKAIVTHSASELTAALGLSAADAVEIEVRSTLNDESIRIVEKSGLTHAQVAKLAGMSRSLLTAILNRNTHGVSTDLMLHIVASLGYRAKVTVSRA
jgi:predicted XRE-type DNA-binding protein